MEQVDEGNDLILIYILLVVIVVVFTTLESK